jgi:hypothetical protein
MEQEVQALDRRGLGDGGRRLTCYLVTSSMGVATNEKEMKHRRQGPRKLRGGCACRTCSLMQAGTYLRWAVPLRAFGLSREHGRLAFPAFQGVIDRSVSGIPPVSFGIPHVSVFFFLFFNSKIGRYVLDTYRAVSGQYPVSVQYPILVRQQSEVSALHSCQAHAFEWVTGSYTTATKFLEYITSANR